MFEGIWRSKIKSLQERENKEQQKQRYNLDNNYQGMSCMVLFSMSETTTNTEKLSLQSFEA